MILKFEDYIKESLWKKGVERSKSGEKRLENGRTYKTSLGEVIEISCSPTDVENCIETMLNYSPNAGGISYNDDGEDEGYLIGHNEEGNEVRAIFNDYDVFKKEFDNVSYDDYEAIIGCVVNAIKNTVKDNVVVVKYNSAYIMLVDENKMDSLCGDDEDMYEDNSGYDRLMDTIRRFVNNKGRVETYEGMNGFGDYPHYLAVQINDWIIHNFDSLHEFVESEWDNLLSYVPDYEEEE